MKCLKFIFVVLGICSYSFLANPAFADTTHVIEKGDTLFSLSKKYGVTVDQIRAANNITDGTTIKLGQRLVIPTGNDAKTVPAATTTATTKPAAEEKSASQTAAATVKTEKKEESQPKLETTTYTVSKGDTWYGISRKNGIAVPQLWALNNVDSTAELKAGQKIKIPVGNATGTVVASAEKQSNTKTTTKATTTAASKTSAPESTTSLASLTDPKSYSKSGDTSLVWPVKATSVNYINGKVGGVKLVAEKNESVKSIASGNVMFSGSYRGFGNVVFIQSKTSHIYAYTGLGKISVDKGDYIVSGTEIGSVGVDSYSKQNSVSLMVFQNGLPIDPAKAPRG